MLIYSCAEDPVMEEEKPRDLRDIPYEPIAHSIDIPQDFPQLEQPADNMMTLDGVLLGKELFYDPIMSIDSSISCASCHFPEKSFTDQLARSPGVNGDLTKRSSMSLLNIGFYYNGLFWDGRSPSLEEQAIHPIIDDIEMDNTWEEVIKRLRRSQHYPEMFRKAFGIENTDGIDRDLTTKAIAQFERTLVSSGNSKYDKVIRGQAVFTDQEQLGFDIYFDRDPELPDGECFHCHSAPLFTNNDYMNNGLVAAEEFEDFPDKGHGSFTGQLIDNGKFRVPTLRNIEYTAPYMHDGRFETLEEVLEHYNSGGQISKGKDALLVPLGMDDEQLRALRAFLSTLNDEDFLNDERYRDPNG
jgi:cytochrome c peroxidase